MVDDDIATLFNTVAQDIEPELAAVIGEATRQGRRRRARRRLALACTAGATAVAVAVAASLLIHEAGRSVHGSQIVGPSHRRVHVLKPKPHHARRAVPQATGPGMKPSQMLSVLKPILPRSWVISWVSPSAERGSIEINFNDGQGAADILLSIMQTSSVSNACPKPLWTNDGPRPAGALPISCVERRLPGGATEEDAVTYADVASYYVYMLYYSRPDGLTIMINVGNGTLDGTPHLARPGWPYVDRARPPGSMALWEKVVESPKWHL